MIEDDPKVLDGPNVISNESIDLIQNDLMNPKFSMIQKEFQLEVCTMYIVHYYFRFVFNLKSFCFRSVGPLPTCFSMRGNLKALRSDASLGSQLQLFKASHKLSIFELRTSCIFSSNKGCGIDKIAVS